MNWERRKAILFRWADILAYGVIAGALWYVLSPAVASVLTPVVDTFTSVPLWPRILVWFVIGCVLLRFVGAGRWMGMLGVRHFWTFPPLWLGICCAIATFILINGVWPRDAVFDAIVLDIIRSASSLAPDYAVALFAAAIALVALRSMNCVFDTSERDLKPTPATDERTPQWRDQLQSLPSLKEWILTDSEVTHPNQDLFDHNSIALRIARRLEESPSDATPTIAIVGEQGAGKSTIGSLVAHHLRTNQQILFVRISLWPFDSSEAAVRGVLSEIVRALGTRVNTLSLTGLPEKYVAIVERLGPWSFFVGLFFQSPNPAELVGQVNEVAMAAGLRIMLWIEDLERFSGTATMEPKAATEREEERLGPIRSLLWLLNRCDRIGVAVADSSLRSRFDLEKIARFVERVPQLDADDAGRVVEVLRQKCRFEYPTTVIDPVHPELRQKFEPTGPLMRSVRNFWATKQEPEPFDALIEVVRTPRTLKSTLRLSLETWEQLPGEIDLDHVIAVSALRSAFPQVFELINNEISWFRAGFRTAGSRHNDPMKHEAFLAFENLLAQRHHESASDAIRSLVRFVFSAFPEDRVIKDTDHQYLERPQGLNIAYDSFGGIQVDYWSRYLTCATLSDEERDQTVLRQIHAWKKGLENDLVELVTDARRHIRIEHFLNQFGFDDLLRILDEVVQHEWCDDLTSWSDREVPQGGVSLWRMLNRCRVRDSRKTADTLEKLMKQLIPSHLPYVQFLFHYFCAPTPGSTVFPLTDAEDTHRLSELIRSQLLEVFPVGSASKLHLALRGASQFLLRDFLGDIRSTQIGGTNPDDVFAEVWPVLSRNLLDLAEFEPRTGIPIILSFVTKVREISGARSRPEGSSSPSAEVIFDRETAAKLFDVERLQSVMQGHEAPDNADEWLRDAWAAAKIATAA